MDKSTRDEFKHHTGVMTRKQIEYAAGDVVATWLIDQAQQKIMEKKDYNVYKIIDEPMIWTALELGGFALDQPTWIEVNQAFIDRAEEIQVEFNQKYGKINLGSWQQKVELLQRFGYDVTSSSKATLSAFAEDEFVKSLLDFSAASTIKNKYGLKFLQFVEADGRIYASLNITPAKTGRSSIDSPPLQQIPRNKDFRKCFVAGDGFDLIVADYGAQEPRCFAEVTGDEILQGIFTSGKDVYCEIARIAFNEVITKKIE
jgi:DNA polymerase I-like protein with 3'-5' exonuclease and polymerase domains